MCDRIGKPRTLLPRVNSGLHGHYHSHFDDECRALFAQRFARDIETYIPRIADALIRQFRC